VVDAAGWRFMFLIIIALGIGAFLASLHVLPSGQGDRPTVIDVLGIALVWLPPKAAQAEAQVAPRPPAP
jgi:predicted MFS family arabinose efflux permease